MLRGLRKASAHWLGKLTMTAVFGFLALSFAIWGIGDIFRGFGRSSVAKVGSTEIGIEQFRQAYNDNLQQLSRKLGRPITPDQARALGLEQQLLGQLVTEVSLDERARQLGLNLSDAEVARAITADPNFRGPTGQFDRFRFQQMVRAAGFTEARYAEEQRRGSLRREIGETVTRGVTAPRTLADLLDRYQNEQRAIEYVLLDTGHAGEIPAPAPEVISKYYEDHKLQFRAPEYRKIATLVVSAEDVARAAEVSEADARRYYQDHIDRYGTPEKRQIEQMVFPNAEAASAAGDRIAKGASFAEIATERGLKAPDIELGLVTKSELLDPSVADAAFALAESTVSAPIAGRFGTVLVQVTKIEPGHTRPYEEAAPEIKQQIAVDRARPQLLDLRDKIEDARAAGNHLDEIAQKYQLKARDFEVDRSGRGPDGKPVSDLPSGVDVVSAAFASDVGVDNEALQLPKGGYVWFDVLGITPSRDRKLDEVRDQVEARWREDEISQRLAAKAAEFVERLKSDAQFADLAAESGLTPKPLWGLKRGNASGPLSVAAINTVFQTEKDAPGVAPGQHSGDRIVFRVTEIKFPEFDPNSPEAKRYTEVLHRSLSEDLFNQYVARLEDGLGVTINRDALRQVHGGSEPD